MNNPRPSEWRRLDNAAKIFPPTSSRKDTKVFRFTCELTETVQPDILQAALDKTMKLFPLYSSTLKKGLFWYFLENSNVQPLVKEEYEPICSRIAVGEPKSLLFQVTYFRSRINLEVYHALSDGTGALHFLRTLVCFYLSLCYPDKFPEDIVFHEYDATRAEQLDDSYQKYYSGKKSLSPRKLYKAYHISGNTLPENRMNVLVGIMSAKELLAKSKEKKVTVTAFLAAVLLCSIYEEMPLRKRNRPITISLPVNLRKHFVSATARNFFSVVKISYNFQQQSSEFEDVLEAVSKALSEELTPEKLSGRINALSALEHNFIAKMIPLMIKNPFMKLGCYLSDRGVTAQFSNIGKVGMPEIYLPYIRRFDMFTSTRRLQVCAASFKDEFMVSFTCPLVSTQIQCTFFRKLVQMGISVTVFSNKPEPSQEV